MDSGSPSLILQRIYRTMRTMEGKSRRSWCLVVAKSFGCILFGNTFDLVARLKLLDLDLGLDCSMHSLKILCRADASCYHRDRSIHIEKPPHSLVWAYAHDGIALKYQLMQLPKTPNHRNIITLKFDVGLFLSIVPTNLLTMLRKNRLCLKRSSWWLNKALLLWLQKAKQDGGSSSIDWTAAASRWSSCSFESNPFYPVIGPSKPGSDQWMAPR